MLMTKTRNIDREERVKNGKMMSLALDINKLEATK